MKSFECQQFLVTFEKCVCLFIHPWYTTAISCLPIISHDTEKKNHALKKTRGNEKMFPLVQKTNLMRQIWFQTIKKIFYSFFFIIFGENAIYFFICLENSNSYLLFQKTVEFFKRFLINYMILRNDLNVEYITLLSKLLCFANAWISNELQIAPYFTICFAFV